MVMEYGIATPCGEERKQRGQEGREAGDVVVR